MVGSLTSKAKDETGTSLVEVVVAMTVLALAIIPLVGMFEAGLRAATTSGEYDAARALANAKLEEVRALPYYRAGVTADSAIERYAPPGPPDGVEDGFAYTIRTAFVDAELANPSDSPPTNQMRVEVTITWKERSYLTAGIVSGEMP